MDSTLYLDILQRAEYMCELIIEGVRCGAPGADIHHIVSRRKFSKKRRAERDDPSNLILLCKPCHHQRHFGGRAFM